jgi:hypothetical protein
MQTLIKTEMNSAALEEQVVPALLVASDELSCSGRTSSTCPTSGICCVKTQVISHVTTTNRIYLWSSVTVNKVMRENVKLLK